MVGGARGAKARAGEQLLLHGLIVSGRLRPLRRHKLGLHRCAKAELVVVVRRACDARALAASAVGSAELMGVAHVRARRVAWVARLHAAAGRQRCWDVCAAMLMI